MHHTTGLYPIDHMHYALADWLETHHDPHWTPGRNGGRIVRRDARGRFTK